MNDISKIIRRGQRADIPLGLSRPATVIDCKEDVGPSPR